MKSTEYQELKRFLFNVKDISPRINGAEVNGMITDACKGAYDALDEGDKAHICGQQRILIDYVKKRGQQLSEAMALELLAAVGDCLNGKGVRDE